MSYRYLYYWRLVLNFPMIYTLMDKYLQCAQMPNLRQRLHYFPADIKKNNINMNFKCEKTLILAFSFILANNV